MSSRSRRRSRCRSDASLGALPSCRSPASGIRKSQERGAERLRALEARFRGMSGLPGVRLQEEDRLLDGRIEPAAAGIDISEDRLAHPGLPELLDMICDSRNDLIGALHLEKLADLVRHVDEAVRRHGAPPPRPAARRCGGRLWRVPHTPPATPTARWRA